MLKEFTAPPPPPPSIFSSASASALLWSSVITQPADQRCQENTKHPWISNVVSRLSVFHMDLNDERADQHYAHQLHY